MQIKKYIIFAVFFLFSNLGFAQLEMPICSHSKANKWRPALRTVFGDEYDLKHYVFDLELTNRNNYIKGNVSMHVNAVSNLDTFWFELRPHLTIDSIFYNGQRLSFLRKQDVVKIALPQSANPGITLVFKIYYQGTPPNTGAFFNTVTTAYDYTWKKPATFTLSQPFGSPDWYPSKQDNTDKIDSLYFIATTDDSLMVGSNGLLIQVEPVPVGKRRFHWKTTYPIASYLVGFAVAKYVDFTSWAKPSRLQGDSVKIQHFVYDAYLPDLGNAINYHKNDILYTNRLVELMSDSFGLYPFYKEKYGHMQAPLGGGMEHQTMSTVGFFTANLNAHELMHQWFGDYVTCSTWEHIWLNEGFGSYGEYFNLEHSNQAEANIWMEDAHNQAVTEPEGSIVVPPNSAVSRIFNRALTFKKAASVIHMLRYQMGDAAFFKGIRDYLQTHAYGHANSTDIRTALETSSSQDLGPFFNEWVFGYGFPSYQIRWNQLEDTLFLEIQSRGSSTQTPTFSIPVPIKISKVNGGFEEINLAPGYHKITFEERISVLNLDEKNVLLKGISNIDKDVNFVSTKPHIERLNVSLWPNPSHIGGFNLNTSAATLLRVNIYNTAGQLLEQIYTNGSVFIKTSLPQGFYLVKIQNLKNGSISTLKWLNLI